MHTLRLLYECRELMTEGRITLPCPERDFLIRVRTGTYSMDKVLSLAGELIDECEQSVETSSLPEKIDRTTVSRLIAHAYLTGWDAL